MGTVTYDFTDETVVITGGSSGIGRAVALAFGEAGGTVVNGDVTREPKDADVPTDAAIEDAGGTAAYVETDVTNREDIVGLLERAGDFGSVDVMVNNAGIQVPGSLLDTPPESFDQIHAVNAKGVFLGTQVAAEVMLERGASGAIVNTASISSNFAQHGQVPYDSTKGAVRMITRGAALELADDGIRVNAVAPGQIATEIVAGWSERARQKAAADEHLKPIPLGRAGEPTDLPGAYLFLASEAAAYITGELLHVDGGWQIC